MFNVPPPGGYNPYGGGPPPQGGGGGYPPPQGGSYGGPPQGSYAPPPQGGSYGPAGGGYPPQGSYAPPQGGGGYGGPPQGGYAPPSQGSSYGPPSGGGYPPQGPYGPPQGGYPQQPPQQGYAAPPGRQYPSQQQYHSQPQYGGPPAQQYGSSASPSYGGPPPQGAPPQAYNATAGMGMGMTNIQGKKRALLIGINYPASRTGRLRGCVNDAKNMKAFLLTRGYPEHEIRLLTDEPTPSSPTMLPTRENILSGISWLVSGAQPGDRLFFHYSGHGGTDEDHEGLEDDGQNETIIPGDYERYRGTGTPTRTAEGHIIDDELHEKMVQPLPEGCQLFAVFDSCHSGTALDLPYLVKASGNYAKAHKDGPGRASRWKGALKKGGAMALLTDEVKYQASKKYFAYVNKKYKSTSANVIQISGCRDSQTSADTTVGKMATGAMSWAFIYTLRQTGGNLSYASLLEGMRDALKNGQKQFSQMPQMSYGRQDMNMEEVFTV